VSSIKHLPLVGVDWKDAVAPLSAMSFIIDYLMGVYVPWKKTAKTAKGERFGEPKARKLECATITCGIECDGL